MALFGAQFMWRTHRPCGVVAADGGRASAPYTQVNGEGVDATAQLPPTSVVTALSNVLTTARATISSFLDLISLEVRRAGIALLWMVVMGFIAAICLGAAWLGLMAVLAMCAVSFGLTPIAAVTAVTVINLVVGAALIYGGIGISRDLLFAATRRQVAGKSTVPPPTP